MFDKHKNIDVEDNPYYPGSPAFDFNMTVNRIPILLMVVLMPYTLGWSIALILGDFIGNSVAMSAGRETDYTFSFISCLIIPVSFLVFRGIGYLYKYLLRENTFTSHRRRQRGEATATRFSAILSFLVFLAYAPWFVFGFAECAKLNWADCDYIIGLFPGSCGIVFVTVMTFGASNSLGLQYLDSLDSFINAKRREQSKN